MKACVLVGVSRRTIYNWMAKRKIEYVRTAGGAVRIFVDTLWRNRDGDAVAPTAVASPSGSAI
jgi:excisionase family DNA binding protein